MDDDNTLSALETALGRIGTAAVEYALELRAENAALQQACRDDAVRMREITALSSELEQSRQRELDAVADRDRLQRELAEARGLLEQAIDEVEVAGNEALADEISVFLERK